MVNTILTERLCLKPYEETDLPQLAMLLTNETIKETFIIPDYPDPEALYAAVRKLYHAALSDAHFERGVYLQDSLIGFVNDVEVADKAIEIGYAIHPDHHNQGYATEMLRAVIPALWKAGYTTVITGAFEQNTASIRVMQKCGLTKIDKEEDMLYHGKTMHCVYYAIDK